ncbi:hypothetical protein B0H10DRAFT_1955720 [Mycena sp. CBHHK59/15]|nr:hypothetical protein B0H10DRAFT_1955720 [Mycena sp. CBHHK59/15]
MLHVPGVETIPDTTVIPEPEPEAEPEVEISVPLSSEMHGDGTDLSRYFWPRYALPVLSNGCQSAADVLTSAGMRLVGLVYDAQKTIMDLGSVFVEFEPLLHTSPQIYTRKQWDGVKQVPQTVASSNIQLFPFSDNNHFKHRGFKIGYAIEFLSHILSWNTFDNNFRLHWRTRDDFVENYEDSHVPDPIYDYPAWCSYCVEWLHEMTRKGSKNFVSSRGLKVEEYYRKASNASAKMDEDNDVDVDFSMNASLDQQLRYVETLRTHGHSRTHEASLKTWDEEFLSRSQSVRENLFNPRTTDMSKVFLPFDLTNVLSSVTKFGHLGQLIAGDYWEGILLELVQHPQKLKQLEDEYCSLTKMLRPLELLFLKPIHLLTPKESAELVEITGWSENPISVYFSQSRFSKPCTRIDQSRLTLTSKRTMWQNTYLVKMETRTGFMWTTLRNAKKRAETEHDPLYTVQSEKTRDKSTIAHIKNKTKGWMVGPYDFVGHGHIIKHSSSSSLLLAPRFICYSDAEDAVHLGCSQSLSRWYAKVEQRSAGTRESLEKQDSAISKEMGKPVAAVAPDYFTKEIIQQRKKERIGTMGPKDTARVKNRSRIASLGKKWAELDEMVEF